MADYRAPLKEIRFTLQQIDSILQRHAARSGARPEGGASGR